MIGLKGADGNHNSSYSVTQLKGLQTNLFGMSNNEVAMSTDSLDEETKRLLAEADPDDSKDSTNDKKKKYPDKTYTVKYDDDGYETNTNESPDSEW